jgi:DNA-directed RNA polymerase II subunit RPB9
MSAPSSSAAAPPPPKRRGLRFCPDSNDLLYPREDREARALVYYCKNCPYTEPVPRDEYCVYVSETKYTSSDKTVVLQDVLGDPTLPRTKDVACPACGHSEAVFYSESTEQGMTLFFNCVACAHKWRDAV